MTVVYKSNGGRIGGRLGTCRISDDGKMELWIHAPDEPENGHWSEITLRNDGTASDPTPTPEEEPETGEEPHEEPEGNEGEGTGESSEGEEPGEVEPGEGEGTEEEPGETDPDGGSDPTPPNPNPGPVQSANIKNRAELDAALATGNPGHYILAPGDYGAPQIPSNVTIEGADPANRPILRKIILVGKQNIELRNIHYQYQPAAGHPDTHRDFYIQDCTNITVRDSLIEGTMLNGNGVGWGVHTWGSNNGLLFEGCEVTGFWKALGLNGNNITVRSCDIHTIRSDGIVTGVGDNYLIEGNYLHDFGTLGGAQDHRDMFQAIGGGTNITIQDNFFDHGVMAHALYTQGIWSDDKSPDYDVTIRRNVMILSHTNGVAWHFVGDYVFDDNVVVQWRDAAGNPRPDVNPGTAIPKVNFSGSTKSFERNQAPAIINPNPFPASNAITPGNDKATRAAAMADPRWSHFFGG